MSGLVFSAGAANLPLHITDRLSNQLTHISIDDGRAFADRPRDRELNVSPDLSAWPVTGPLNAAGLNSKLEPAAPSH